MPTIQNETVQVTSRNAVFGKEVEKVEKDEEPSFEVRLILLVILIGWIVVQIDMGMVSVNNGGNVREIVER